MGHKLWEGEKEYLCVQTQSLPSIWKHYFLNTKKYLRSRVFATVLNADSRVSGWWVEILVHFVNKNNSYM